MKQYRSGLGPALAFVAAVFGCSTTTKNSAEPPDETVEPVDDAGAEDASKPKPGKPSCDPYEPRASSPEVLIGPTGLEKKLGKLIEDATTSLDVEMYEFDTESLIDALVAAEERGVKVRLVIDRNHTTPSKTPLTAAGVEVKESSEDFPYAHAKTMIIDGARAVIMSANMNSYSMKSERNYGIVDVEADDIAGLQQIFDHDWAGGGSVGLELPCTRLVVAPINARERLAEFMSKAEKTLDLAVMYVTDDAFVDALAERAAAGTTVRVLLADPGWMENNDATAAALVKKNISVRYLQKYELHAKLVLTESAAFVGSENFSRNSVDANREVGLFVTNEEPVATIRKQFETDWESGVDP